MYLAAGFAEHCRDEDGYVNVRLPLEHPPRGRGG
jgi:hypothetical protein